MASFFEAGPNKVDWLTSWSMVEAILWTVQARPSVPRLSVSMTVGWGHILSPALVSGVPLLSGDFNWVWHRKQFEENVSMKQSWNLQKDVLIYLLMETGSHSVALAGESRWPWTHQLLPLGAGLKASATMLSLTDSFNTDFMHQG